MIELEQKVKQIINENIPNSLQDFRMDLRLVDIGIDSFTFINIIVAIENEFNFEFGDGDLDYKKFPNLGFLVLYIQNKINNLT